MNIKPLNGHAIIKTKQVMDDVTEAGVYKDISFNKTANVTIHAEVIESSQRGDNEVIFEIVDGVPLSRERKRNPNYVRASQIGYDVRPKDIVFFHYLTLEDPSNFLTVEGEWKIFKVPLSSIFLSMRESVHGEFEHKGKKYTPIMHNQYVLGRPFWGWDWEQVDVDGKMVGAKVNSFGLVTETKDKPIEDTVEIVAIGKGVKPYSRYGEVQKGDVTLLKKSSNFVNNIFGQDLWVFGHTDIIAIRDSETKIRPTGNYTKILLDERTYEGNLHVDVSKLKLNNRGVVKDTGALVDVMQKDMYVQFDSKRAKAWEQTYAFVEEHDIYGVFVDAMYSGS